MGEKEGKGEINRADSAISFLGGVQNAVDSSFPRGMERRINVLRTLLNILLSRLVLD